MIEFNCPHCGLTMRIDGKSIPAKSVCPSCQKRIATKPKSGPIRKLFTCGIVAFLTFVIFVCVLIFIFDNASKSGGLRNTAQKRSSDSESSSTQVADKSAEPAPVDVKEEPKKSRFNSSRVMVRVNVWNDTESRPMDDRAEVWFRGHGTWWLKEETKFGAAANKLGYRDVGKKDTLHVYPDSRSGKEIVIPIMMTSEMNPESSDLDTINIQIEDKKVKVWGRAVKAATGKPELEFSR